LAQKKDAAIKGTITMADGNAAYAYCSIKKLKNITVTDNNGVFELQNLPALEDSVIITSVGSQSISFAVKLGKSEKKDLGIIYLNTKIIQLRDVEITGRITKSYKSDYSYFSSKTETQSGLIAQSVSTITKELIQDKMELTLKDAVDNAPGVNQYSGYDEYTIRGFRAENARNINGLRGYNTTYTSGMLVNVERIEIIKGPVATLYGNCDPGGTINLVTKKPLTTTGAEINIYGGAWNHFRVEGDVTGPVNKKKTLLYRFNAGYDKANSFRNGYYTKSYQLAPSFTFIPSDKFKINVDISLSHINTILDRGQPGFLNDTLLQSTPINLSVTQPGDYLQETDIASVVTGSYKITKNLNFNTGFLNYVTQQNVAEHGLNSYITNDSIFLYYDKWDYHTVTNTVTNYLTWQHDIGRVSNHLLLGYDFVKSSINLGQQYFELPGEFGEGSGIVGAFSLKNPQYIKRPVNTYHVSDYDNDATDVDGEIYHTHGVYIQDEISYHKWRFLLGLRQEFYKGDDDDDDEGGVRENVFLPRINILYSIKPNLHIYATYNNGFDPFEASTATQVFEDPFKPIRSQLLETGIKADLFNNQLSASLALYQLIS
jgi:iron complex outermembrane receptor protein